MPKSKAKPRPVARNVRFSVIPGYLQERLMLSFTVARGKRQFVVEGHFVPGSRMKRLPESLRQMADQVEARLWKGARP